jgi:hypothetical protein
LDQNRSSPRLAYTDNARVGTVIYIDGETRITFWHEIYGQDCRLIINVPDEADLEKETKSPVEK